MNTELNTKEKAILKSYIREMIDLFSETDMIGETDSIYLPLEQIYVNRQELVQLEKKLKIVWN